MYTSNGTTPIKTIFRIGLWIVSTSVGLAVCGQVNATPPELSNSPKNNNSHLIRTSYGKPAHSQLNKYPSPAAVLTEQAQANNKTNQPTKKRRGKRAQRVADISNHLTTVSTQPRRGKRAKLTMVQSESTPMAGSTRTRRGRSRLKSK